MSRRTSFLFFSTLLFVGLLVFVSAEQKNVTAEPGQPATLPCQAPNNNNIAVLEWSRADLGEKYVLLFRDEQFDPENQYPSFVNRVELQDRQMNNGDVSLILKNMTSNDTGAYECRVVQRETKRRKRAVLDVDPISIINLSVDPPGQPGGHTEDGGKKDGGKKDGGSFGLKVGLSVAVPAVLLFVAVAFLIYRKHKQDKKVNYESTCSSQS